MITVTVVDESVQVSVPGWVKDVGSFRRWADADDFPEGGVIYWLVDARKDPPQFDVLRHTARGQGAARKQDGWVKSGVFGRSFRLVRRAAFGHPAYTLEVR